MNRYDVASVAKFNPMSYQEIMAAPLMQRQKHDQLIAQQEALRQGLAKVDPLDVHFNKALELKNNINNRILNQATQLSKEGVNPNSQADFLSLNREYQDLVSPTGELGQINAAKAIYTKNFNDYLEDATKNKGWSRERALANWNEFSKQYTGFDANNRISSIGQFGAPKKIEVLDVLKDVKGLLGEQVVGEMRASGYHFDRRLDGSMVMVDRSGRRIETSNRPNLQHAQNLINQRLMGKEWQDSIKFEGENTQNIYSQLTSGINSMLSNKVVDNRSDNAQYIAPKSENDDGVGTIISNNSTLTSDALENKNYTSALNTIKKLQTSKSLSPADKAKLDDLIELRRNADSKLKNNVTYTNLQKELSNNEKQFDTFVKNYKDGKLKLTPSQYTSRYNTLQDNIRMTQSNMQKEKDNAWKNSSSLRHDYSYLPSNPKEESIWNLYNENIFNTLKGVDLGNVLDLTSIYTTTGSKKDINPNDVKNIQSLLKGADSKSFKINNVKTYGDNKTPEITVTFNSGKNAEQYDFDRGLFSEGRNSKFGGAEEPVTITFKLKDFSNAGKTGSAAGYKSLSGAIAKFWKDKGEINEITGLPQGREVYSSFVENQYKSYSNEKLNELSKVDADAREALMIRAAKYAAAKQ